MQKIHKHGTDGDRYFWMVTIAGEGSGEYRSRHSTAAGVRAEFAKHGKKVTRVRAVRA